jgi:hypothetical protein
MRPLGDVAFLARVFEGNPTARLVLLRSVWPGIVGPEIARRTRVQALSGQQLQIRVTDARWMRVLHRLQGRLLADMRRAVGTLAPRQLGFIEGHPEVAPTEAAIPTCSPPVPPSPPESVTSAAQSIDDPDVRRVFLSSAALYLARFAG